VRSDAKAPSAGSTWIAAASAFFLALSFLAISSAPASAAMNRPILRTMSVGPGTNADAMATDSAGNVYIMSPGPTTSSVSKFSPTGNPVPFTGSARYIDGNELTGDPERHFSFFGQGYDSIAVDHSGGPTDGYIYLAEPFDSVTGAAHSIRVFDSAGIYQGELDPTLAGGAPCGVAVNQSNGAVYVGTFYTADVYRYDAPTGDPADARPNAKLLNVGTLCQNAVDSTGAIYVFQNGVTKYDASQFGLESPLGTQVDPEAPRTIAVTDGGDVLLNRSNRVYQRTAAGALVGSPFPLAGLSSSLGVTAGQGGQVFVSDQPEGDGGIFVFGPTEVDLPLATTGAASNVTLHSADVVGEVDPDSAGGVTKCEIRYGPDAGYSEGSVPCTPGASVGTPITSPTPVSATLTGLRPGVRYHYRVFVTNANGTGAGADQTFTTTPIGVEAVTTGAATAVTKDGAELHGSYVGNGEDVHYYFEYGLSGKYGQTVPASPGNDAGSGGGPQEVAPVQLSGLKYATAVYHYRLVVSTPEGKAYGQDERFTTAQAITNPLADPPTEVTNKSAVLNGSFDADKYGVNYYFEWGPTTSYGQVAPVPPGNFVAPGSGRVSVPPVAIGGLQEGATYHYRLVASNEVGITFGPDASFKTAEPPRISHLATTNVRLTSADLTAEINPRYGETTYHFEWGRTSVYGNTVPIPDGNVGAGNVEVPVSAELDGLSEGATYHFRLIATNKYGTTTSVDQTFGFYPPACPNSQVRQETGSNSLPDCRAYELASPANMQGATIFPRNGPNTGLATNPSRVAYAAGFGVFPPETGNPPNSIADLYVSTRTDVGWFTKYVGRPATATVLMGGPPLGAVGGITQNAFPSSSNFGAQASPSMDRFIDYDLGFPSNNGAVLQRGTTSNAPYVWDASSGASLGRWPSNLSEVPGGEDFVGKPVASADFTHFVFSSNVAFAPDGESFPNKIGCCPGIASTTIAPIYDNDLATGEVSLVSRKHDGTPFRGNPVDVSQDGSRILMSEEEAYTAGVSEKPVNAPLFLRVNDAKTYDIAAGRSYQYVGSANAGSTVYITSAEQLTADDHDTSVDLFAWKEGGTEGTLTRISFGSEGEVGNTDACTAGWTTKCDIGLIPPPPYDQGSSGQETGNGVSDTFIAAGNGDIYFNSPEKLDGEKGELGGVNLYLYRNGIVRYITTTQVAAPIIRIEVVPDGTHAAFTTASRLTAYDNAGHTEMYVVTPANGRIDCVSCRPDGAPATTDVYGSQNGLFLTNDGRAFFSTEDALVPRDTDEVNDVYEYVEGKPQLISAGLGEGLGELYYGFNGTQTVPGLMGVSANGTDVYFATYDNLVTQDHNGHEVKIYDARVGGGFPADRQPANCAAADECHGPGSSQPALPPDRTSANLGKVGKPHGKQQKKKHRKQKKSKSKKKGKTSHGKHGRQHRG
jgi:hypothetical protein